MLPKLSQNFKGLRPGDVRRRLGNPKARGLISPSKSHFNYLSNYNIKYKYLNRWLISINLKSYLSCYSQINVLTVISTKVDCTKGTVLV